MYFSDWLVGLRSPRPMVRVRRHLRDAVMAAQIGRLEPRVMLTAQPVAPVEDSAAYIAYLEAGGAVIDVAPPVDPHQVQSQGAPGPAQGPFPDGDTFLLHSRSSATKVIYLDFDGHTNTGTPWNNAQRPTIVTPAFDFEGGAGTFTTNELGRIQQIWQRVAEAYSPFDVDVTTEEPTGEDLKNTGAGDTRWGMRVIIGGDSQQTLGISAGGVAYVGSFDGGADIGCYVFPLQLGPNNEKFIADATVHEVGHTVGLVHDGVTTVAGDNYYGGHGTGPTGWAPHMGVGYSRELVQFSKGEYPNANNQEDDLNIIVTQNGFGYRPDDRGGSSATATPITVNLSGVVVDGGVIERNTDQDWYRFNTAGATNFTINPAVRGAMLDILAEIYDSNGQLVQSSNPVDQLNASFSTVLPVGTYFLKIDGTGKAANGNDFGYSDYGSIGQYFITGNIQLQPNNPPVINDQGFTIAENSPNGTVVGTVAATDSNTGQLLTYAITAGNTNNTFAINAATGQITVNDPTLLNFEVPTAFNLTVQVTDDGTPVLSDTATVTIAVTNVNEPPVVTGATYFVLEQPPLGIAIGTLQAVDPDAGQTMTWSITGGNTGNAFAINATTGLISVATPSAIVAATTPTFSLTVQALDNGTPALSGSATVTVNVINNNQSPVVDDQTFTLPENSAAGTVVGTVAAADPDAGQTITYSITAGNAGGAFALNAATGELTVANPAALDFETNPTLQLTVKVTDNVIPGGSDTVVITVNLTNVNDPPAVNPATFTVIEFTPNGSLVGTVAATDQDAGQTVTYALLSGNTGNAFALDAATGKITIADTTQIDFQTVPTYSLQVQVTDSGNPAASSTAVITINVSDVNRPPYLPDQAFRVFEGSPPGTLVGTVFTSDPDVGQPQMLSIIGGNVGNAFAIHPTSGKLTVNNPFAVDFETMPVFNLTVEVRDNSLMPQVRTANMLIEVLDVVEQPVIQPQSFTVAENRPVGYIVGNVIASHFDPMTTLTFAITGGNADGIFAINSATGQLKVAKATLNFETTPEVTLTVTVTDDGSPAESRSASMTITVLDLNEAPALSPVTFNISENRPVGYVVGSVKAFDQDVGQSLTYAITGGNTNGTFAINQFTGVLTVAKGTLNHETTPQFLLTVSATDNGTPVQSKSAAVTINVLNLNEPPVINPQTFTVSENRAAGFVVGQIAAVDQDVGQTLTYAIVGGDPDGIFAVNPNGQLVIAKPILNFEAASTFQLQVSVTDNGSPVQSRSAPVTVNVRDLNEAPVVNPQTFTIAEKLPLGSVVGTVIAFEQDFNQTLQFAITA
ncbi:MAG TPA: cadherin domain-containing protein, partial [Planctomycetaceae bacterium]|nr:cadherin domain-containing protein [Planctomycetaceae bacterium]